MNFRRVLLLTVLSLVLITSQVFAGASEYGYYIGTLVNGDYYEGDSYYLLDNDGIYYDLKFYKDALNIGFVENETNYDVVFKGETLFSFTKDQMFPISDDLELPIYSESEDDIPFILFEFISESISEDLGYKWETVSEEGIPAYKNVYINASESLVENTDLVPLVTSFKPKSTKDLRNTLSYIKKLTKKPTVKANEIKFADKQCTVIATFNMSSGNALDRDVNFTITGKLSPEAINLLTVILKDLVEAKDIKPMVDTLKRLTNVAVAPQTDRKTYDKLLKGPYFNWHVLGDYFKYMAKFEVVEKKTYVEVYLTDFFTDTYNYND